MSIFSFCAIIFGFVLVFFQNPMYSILSLVGCILSSIFFLSMFGIQFISFIYLVVYIGAIAILFLFVVMMLNINCINSTIIISSTVDTLLYLIIFFKFTYFIYLINNQSIWIYQDSIFRNFNLSINTHSDTFSYFTELTFLGLQRTQGVENWAALLVSGLGATSDLASFCLLYDVFFIYLVLAGFILLFAMLGSISLCIIK